MARRLKAGLESRLGVRVLLTRDDDRGVSISDRTALANNNKADLFISLHVNAAPRGSVAGAAVYTAAVAGGPAAGEVPASQQLPALGGGVRDIELVPWNLAQARYAAKSELLAQYLVEGFKDQVPLAATPHDTAPLRILQSANMPAVLIEAGFVSNPGQEGQLAGAAFQNAFSQAIVDAVTRFRYEGMSSPEGPSR